MILLQVKYTITGSDLVQRLLQVGGQVVHVLQSQRYANQVVHHADRAAVVLRVVEEGHRRHLRHQAFTAAEAGRYQEQFERINELAGCLVTAFKQEGDYAAKAAHLPDCDSVVRVRLQAGIPDLLDFWMRLQHMGDSHAGAGMMLHTERKALQSSFAKEQ